MEKNRKYSNDELIGIINKLSIQHESQKKKMLSIVDQLNKEEEKLYEIEEEYKKYVNILKERTGNG